MGSADRRRLIAASFVGAVACGSVGPREVSEAPIEPRAASDRLRAPGAPRLVTAQRHERGSHLVLIDERGLRIRDLMPIDEAPAIDANPDWSPDGAWIAFASSRGRAGPAETSIWIVPVFGGGEPVRITDAGGVDSTPAFSPDGKRIAFTSTRGGGFGIFVVDVAPPREPRRITDAGVTALSPSWLPDGRLLYTASDGTSSWIAIAGGDGTGARRLTEGPRDTWASASPDGRTIVFSARAPGEDRVDQDLFLVDVDGRNRRRLADSSLGDEKGARFSGDGRYVFATSVAKTDRGDPIWSSVVFVSVDGDGVLRALYEATPAPRHGIDAAPVPLDAEALAEAPRYREALRAAIGAAAPGSID